MLSRMNTAWHVEGTELFSYDHLNVKWAIIGAERSGSSSLAMNLQRHPEIETLVGNLERRRVWEHDLFTGSWPAYLPTSDQFWNINRIYRKANFPSLVRGLKDPSCLRTQPALARIAQIRSLVAFVILRDPVDLSEWHYLKALGDHFQKKTNMQTPSLLSCVEEQGMVADVHHADTQRFVDLRRWVFDDPLSSRIHVAAAELGSNRLLLVDRSELMGGRSFWNRLARFIGVGPYPSGAIFGIANSRSAVFNSSRSVVSKIRDQLQADPLRYTVHQAGLLALRRALSKERRALRDLLQHLPSARPPGALPAWAKTI